MEVLVVDPENPIQAHEDFMVLLANGEGSHPGTGQGTTTREFKETTGTLYSTGGNSSSSANGGNNTGNGGGGCAGSCTGGSGGSGIVVIRAHKVNG